MYVIFLFVLRVNISRPEVSSGSPLLDFSAKKPRKFYAVSPEKWYLGSKISEEDYAISEAKFFEIDKAGDGNLVKMVECLEQGRVYLQIKFRNEDPSTHVKKLKCFWKMPHGPELLSRYFEWLVEGSRDSNLAFSIEDHIDPVLKMTARILGDKKGDGWNLQLVEMENNCRMKNGNDTLVNVFIIRELAKSWKNPPEKLIFIQGEDDIQNASQQPYIHVLKIDQRGENDYEEAIVISVRVGTTTIFDEVSLTQGLAAVIQLCFVFHLMYPNEADDIFNFVQRILAKFGPSDGAKNMKGKVKKRFVDFQCDLSNIVLLEKSGTVHKMFV